jgi:protein SCO1
MQKPAQKFEWLVWGGLIAVVIGIAVAFVISKGRGLQQSPPLPTIKAIADFSLTNQFGETVSLEKLRGHVWLGDIIFTRCPGPCARMTKQFAEIQSSIGDTQNVKFISLTADPEYDTAEVLKKYGERFGANQQNWWFLTGRKPDLYTVATDRLLLAVAEKTPEERETSDDLFIHSTIFVLVDKNATIRGVYESEKPESKRQILADIKKLLQEK